MYRWLLCLRYLKTRYIALASIISVTLGVATLIVVNSVMLSIVRNMVLDGNALCVPGNDAFYPDSAKCKIEPTKHRLQPCGVN